VQDPLARASKQRGLDYVRSNQWTEAVAEFSKAIEWNPNSFDAYHERAHAYVANSQFQKAVDDVAAAIKRAPQDTNMLAHLYNDRAVVHLRMDDYEKALGDFGEVTKLDQRLGLNALAWYYVVGPSNFRSPKKALPLALKAVELSNTNHNELNTLGVVYYQLGQLTNAIATLEGGIKKDSAGGSAHDFFFLAMAYHRLGNAVQAENYYAKAIKWISEQPSLQPGWKEELDAFRAEAEEVLGKAKPLNP